MLGIGAKLASGEWGVDRRFHHSPFAIRYSPFAILCDSVFTPTTAGHDDALACVHRADRFFLMAVEADRSPVRPAEHAPAHRQ